MAILNTIKELLLSRDKSNMAIASEILKTYPAFIDATFINIGSLFEGNGNQYGNKINIISISTGNGCGKDLYRYRGASSYDRGWLWGKSGAGIGRYSFQGGGYGHGGYLAIK